MAAYRIELTPDDNDTLLVTAPAFPEVTSFGDDETDALAHGAAAIEEAIAARIHAGLDVPPGDSTADAPFVRLPLLTSLKVDLYRALRASSITRAELTRRLGWQRNSVDRLFDISHASRLEQLEAAIHQLGYDFDARLSRATAHRRWPPVNLDDSGVEMVVVSTGNAENAVVVGTFAQPIETGEDMSRGPGRRPASKAGAKPPAP